jgi:hypothetical protein
VTTPPVAFPDVVALLVDDLRTYLTVRLERTGGPRRSRYVDGPQVSLEAWAPTENGAAHLAELCRRRINALPGRSLDGHAMYQVEEASGPTRLPDPDSDAPRYVITWRLSVRGTTP